MPDFTLDELSNLRWLAETQGSLSPLNVVQLVDQLLAARRENTELRATIERLQDSLDHYRKVEERNWGTSE